MKFFYELVRKVTNPFRLLIAGSLPENPHHLGMWDTLILLSGFAILGIVWLLGVTLLALSAAKFL